MIVERLGDFEAAAAHVADRPDRPEETRDYPEGGEARLFGAAQDADLKTGFGGDGVCERWPVRRAADRFRSRHVDLGDTHRIGNGAKPPHPLDRAAKALPCDLVALPETL